MCLSAKFVKALVVLSAFVVGVVAVTTPTPAPASATGVSCSVYVANETGNTVSVIVRGHQGCDLLPTMSIASKLF